MAMESPPVGHQKLLSPASSNVDDHPAALGMSNTEGEKLRIDDMNEKVKLYSVSRADEDYLEKISELHHRLDMVKEIVRPGCSDEVLKTALCFMSSLATLLSQMPPQKLHASL